MDARYNCWPMKLHFVVQFIYLVRTKFIELQFILRASCKIKKKKKKEKGGAVLRRLRELRA